MSEIIGRKEAKARGLKRYFTGLPCIHGHVDQRLVSSFGCMECCRIKSKKWGRENPDLRFQRHRKWVEENPERCRAYGRAHYWKNPELLRQRGRAYAAKNAAAAWERVKKWRKDNPEKYKENCARYRKAHTKEITARSNIYMKKRYHSDVKFRAKRLDGCKKYKLKNPERFLELKRKSSRDYYYKNLDENRRKKREYAARYLTDPAKRMKVSECSKKRYWRDRKNVTRKANEYGKKLRAHQRAAQIALSELGITAPKREALIALRRLGIKLTGENNADRSGL